MRCIGKVAEGQWKCFDDFRACAYNAEVNLAVRGRGDAFAKEGRPFVLISRGQTF
jgi:hypothetical protein